MFDDQEFDARSWVNAVFEETPPPNVAKETYPSLRILKLQTEIQGNGELDSLCDQLIKDLPSVMRSVDVLAQEVDSLRESMAIVRNDIEAVEQNTAESMALLMQLDTVKSRLLNTVNTLEACVRLYVCDQYSQIAHIEQHSSDVSVVYDAVVQMQEFMQTAYDGDEFSEKQRLHQELCNRMLHLLDPEFETAISNLDAVSANNVLKYYTSIDKRQHAISLYLQFVKNHIVSENISANQDDQLHRRLHTYFEDISAKLGSQDVFCEKTFGDSIDRPLYDILDEIYGAISYKLERALKLNLPQGAPMLLPEVANCLEVVETSIFQLLRPTQSTARVILRAFTTYQLNFAEFLYHHMKAVAENIGSAPSLAESSLSSQNIADYGNRLAENWTAHCRSISQLAGNDSSLLCMRITGCGATDSIASALARICQQTAAIFTNRVVQFTAAASSSLADVTNTKAVLWMVVEPLFFCMIDLGRLLDELSQSETTLRRYVLEHRGGQASIGGDSLNFLEDSNELLADIERSQTADGHPSLLHDYLRDSKEAQRDALAMVRTCLKGLPLFDATRQELFKFNNQLHECALDLLLVPIIQILQSIPRLQIWHTEEQDTTTLEFVTKISGEMEALMERFETLEGKDDLLIATRNCTATAFASILEGASSKRDDDQTISKMDDRHEKRQDEIDTSFCEADPNSSLSMTAGILCNAVLEIGEVDEALVALNEMLRATDEQLMTQMKTRAETPLAAATFHAARLRGLVD
eukprot:gene9230-1514_t